MPDATEAAGKAAMGRMVGGLREARKVPRPRKGWLHLFRKTMHLSAGEVARRMKVSRHQPLQFEQAEARDSITLHSLRRMADAMGFDLVYGLIPKHKPAVVIEGGLRHEWAEGSEGAYPTIDLETALTELVGLLGKEPG